MKFNRLFYWFIALIIYCTLLEINSSFLFSSDLQFNIPEEFKENFKSEEDFGKFLKDVVHKIKIRISSKLLKSFQLRYQIKRAFTPSMQMKTIDSPNNLTDKSLNYNIDSNNNTLQSRGNANEILDNFKDYVYRLFNLDNNQSFEKMIKNDFSINKYYEGIKFDSNSRLKRNKSLFTSGLKNKKSIGINNNNILINNITHSMGIRSDDADNSSNSNKSSENSSISNKISEIRNLKNLPLAKNKKNNTYKLNSSVTRQAETKETIEKEKDNVENKSNSRDQNLKYPITEKNRQNKIKQNINNSSLGKSENYTLNNFMQEEEEEDSFLNPQEKSNKKENNTKNISSFIKDSKPAHVQQEQTEEENNNLFYENRVLLADQSKSFCDFTNLFFNSEKNFQIKIFGKSIIDYLYDAKRFAEFNEVFIHNFENFVNNIKVDKIAKQEKEYYNLKKQIDNYAAFDKPKPLTEQNFHIKTPKLSANSLNIEKRESLNSTYHFIGDNNIISSIGNTSSGNFKKIHKIKNILKSKNQSSDDIINGDASTRHIKNNNNSFSNNNSNLASQLNQLPTIEAKTKRNFSSNEILPDIGFSPYLLLKSNSKRAEASNQISRREKILDEIEEPSATKRLVKVYLDPENDCDVFFQDIVYYAQDNSSNYFIDHILMNRQCHLIEPRNVSPNQAKVKYFVFNRKLNMFTLKLEKQANANFSINYEYTASGALSSDSKLISLDKANSTSKGKKQASEVNIFQWKLYNENTDNRKLDLEIEIFFQFGEKYDYDKVMFNHEFKKQQKNFADKNVTYYKWEGQLLPYEVMNLNSYFPLIFKDCNIHKLSLSLVMLGALFVILVVLSIYLIVVNIIKDFY